MAYTPSKDNSRINLVQLVDDTGASLGVTASTTVKATAAAPTYVEGSTTNPLSTDLSGALRVAGSFSASSATKSTAADPTYVEGVTTNPVSVDLTGYQRVSSKQNGTWTVQIGNTPNTTAIKVDGSAVTQPVSGTVAVTGVATAANQATVITNTGNTATGVGAPADAAWASGSGSMIAILKTIATQVLSATAQAVLNVLTAAANGLTSSRVNAAASTNATSLKASAGNIGEIDVYNPAAYDVFLKFYNKASAPTVGTDTPVWTIPIKAGSGYSKTFIRGKSFSTGIAYAITKLQADSDTTVVVAGDLTGSIDWI